jgi:hypothetical protein
METEWNDAVLGNTAGVTTKPVRITTGGLLTKENIISGLESRLIAVSSRKSQVKTFSILASFD